MIINYNVGLLGHVDSGKTTLAKSLSSINSTAAFDKNPQSCTRGITLDLGFSATLTEAPSHIILKKPELKQVQFTFVDCPGHASLIKTVIGGAHIIDLMLLVVDVQKGVQTQTAECIVIGEILHRKLIVVVNKIDLLEPGKKDTYLCKLAKKLRKLFSNTQFGESVPICYVSAQNGTGIQEIIARLKENVSQPQRQLEKPFIMYIDHCFSIKGQGTICTGTVVQGLIKVNDTIEFPAIKEIRKIKSIQTFHKPIQIALTGDRVGICITQFNANRVERGLICKPDYLKPIYAVVIKLKPIRYYKCTIKSKSKLNISVGHDTVVAKITLFKNESVLNESRFKENEEYEYVNELQPQLESFNKENVYYALLEFEKSIFLAVDAILVASNLDIKGQENTCRLAFWGTAEWCTTSLNYKKEHFTTWKIFKTKQKRGTIYKVVNKREIIVRNLFKVETDRQLYIGKQVKLSTGELGYIASAFGQNCKVRIALYDYLNENTLKMMQASHNQISITLDIKTHIFNKSVCVN